jgi:hypothetical protein
MFAVMNVYTGDQAKLTLQVAEWCHYLEDLPMYATRKAAKWSVVSKDKLPSVAAFIRRCEAGHWGLRSSAQAAAGYFGR